MISSTDSRDTDSRDTDSWETAERGHDRRAMWAIFLLLVGIYGLCAGGHTYSSDEEAMYITTESILNHGDPTFAITSANNRVIPITTGRTGKPVTFTGLGQSVVGMPLDLVGRVVAIAVPHPWKDFTHRLFLGWTNSFVTAAGAVVFFCISRRLGAKRWAAIALTLTYGLCTMAWPHAKTFFSEPLTTTLLLASTLFAIRAAQTGNRHDIVWSGVFGGLSIFARASAAIFLPVIVLYLALRLGRRHSPIRSTAVLMLTFCLGAVPLLALFGLSNWWRFGSPTNMGYPPVNFSYPLLQGLYGFFLSPGKSLFLYAPVVLPALLAALLAPRRYRPEAALFILLAMVNTVFFARFYQWHGDHAWGPRYLMMSLPFFILPLAVMLTSRRWRRALAGTAALGFLSSALGTVMYFNQYFYVVEHTLGSHTLADGPSYWRKMHFDPYWSPILGEFRALPKVIQDTGDRLDRSSPSLVAYPATTNDRYGWYFSPVQDDSWIYWIFPLHAPRRLLVFALPFATSAILGLEGFRRLRQVGQEDGQVGQDGQDVDGQLAAL